MHNLTHNQAWRIYRLICANRDAEADAELRALGDEMIPVAHSLVLGSFRTSSAVRYLWYLIGTGLVMAPLAVTMIVSKTVGTPRCYSGLGEEFIFYFGVFGATFLVEICAAAVVLEVNDRRLQSRKTRHPNSRTNEMAGFALADATGDSRDLLGAILDSGTVDPEPSAALRRKLDSAVLRLLPGCDMETLISLTRSQRNGLMFRLSRIAGIVRARAERRTRYPLDRSDDYRYALLGLTIVNAYERLPDEAAVEIVRSIAKQTAVEDDAIWLPLTAAARHCLPILEERVLQARGGKELLRGSGAVSVGADELLRTVQNEAERDGETLLRAAPSGSSETG